MTPETLGMTLAFVVVGGLFLAALVLSIGVQRNKSNNRSNSDENKQDHDNK